MKKNKFALQIFVFVILISSFIACDKDFTTLDSDILNSDVATNFDITSNTWDVITYTDPFVDKPVQTNGLSLSTLGFYDDLYGRVSSDFVTQVTLSTYEPEFVENIEDIDDIEIDSVVLTIPFEFNVTDIDEDGNITYDIDSVIGRNPIKLRIFENNYFLRDFDPNGDLDEEQIYFSNRTASSSEDITGLEGDELIIIPNPEEKNEITLDPNGNIIISDQGFVLTETTGEGEEEEESITNQSPGIRLMLDPQFWFDKIIERQDDAVLSNQNNFLEHFRGLYFKSEPVNNEGSFLFLNTTSSNIIIYYTSPTTNTDGEEIRQQASITVNLSGNRVNFLDNDFNITIPEGDSETGDQRLFLKGGQGSLGKVKLFNGDDFNDGDDTTFDEWKSEFVEVDEDGNFERSKRLVNEANLVFYVDNDALQTPSISQDAEPNRIYLYDVDNKTPLVDYFFDGVNNVIPSFSIANHLGPLQRIDDDDPDSDGVKYKFRITEHINNLLVNDSTNVELGIAVSLNVNLEGQISQREIQLIGDSDITIPTSSVLTPRGTVLHGNNTEDTSKKVYLEIYYTCIDDEDDCENEN